MFLGKLISNQTSLPDAIKMMKHPYYEINPYENGWRILEPVNKRTNSIHVFSPDGEEYVFDRRPEPMYFVLEIGGHVPDGPIKARSEGFQFGEYMGFDAKIERSPYFHKGKIVFAVTHGGVWKDPPKRLLCTGGGKSILLKRVPKSELKKAA